MTKAKWHSEPGNRNDFAKLLETPVMQDAIAVLQNDARVTHAGEDTIKIALEHKRLLGFQQCINTLLSLAVKPAERIGKLPRQFSDTNTDQE